MNSYQGGWNSSCFHSPRALNISTCEIACGVRTCICCKVLARLTPVITNFSIHSNTLFVGALTCWQAGRDEMLPCRDAWSNGQRRALQHQDGQRTSSSSCRSGVNVIHEKRLKLTYYRYLSTRPLHCPMMSHYSVQKWLHVHSKYRSTLTVVQRLNQHSQLQSFTKWLGLALLITRTRLARDQRFAIGPSTDLDPLEINAQHW